MCAVKLERSLAHNQFAKTRLKRMLPWQHTLTYCTNMRLRLAHTHVNHTPTAYTWYLNNKPHNAKPGLEAPRIFILMQINTKKLNPKVTKAQNRYNGVFWRVKLPLRGLVSVFLCSAIVLLSTYSVMGWLNSLTLGVALHLSTCKAVCTSPVTLFLGLFVINTLKKAAGLTVHDAQASSHSHQLRSNIVYPMLGGVLLFFALLGASLRGVFYREPTLKTDLLWQGGPTTKLTYLLTQGWFGTATRHIDSYIGRAPQNVFKTSAHSAAFGQVLCGHRLVWPNTSDLLPTELPAHLIMRCDNFAHAIRLTTLMGRGNSPVWGPAIFQLHERTNAVRVLMSAWRLSTEAILAKPHVSGDSFETKKSHVSNALRVVKERSVAKSTPALTSFEVPASLGFAVELSGHRVVPTLSHRITNLQFGVIQIAPSSLKTKPWARI